VNHYSRESRELEARSRQMRASARIAVPMIYRKKRNRNQKKPLTLKTAPRKFVLNRKEVIERHGKESR